MLTASYISHKIPVQPQKTVAGIGNPHIIRRPNRAQIARFLYGFGRSGLLRQAVPYCGISNSVRPAHPRLETWQAGVVNAVRRLAMSIKNSLGNCNQDPSTHIPMEKLEEALSIAQQLVARDGPIFQPVLDRIAREVSARQTQPTSLAHEVKQ
ncbi:hypothetical protein C8N36_103143 [Pelagimonas varians]|uniref:Uncharacterized protein n=1 Tax=Pelagimonas varians TaxID=696760 RepID=A0A238KF68_9RHOB|nr:hypothetical protein C8N36_103143 [Pelagimonas varians]SMX41479.1 hypothetical protein PEV8663_02286 [Pelagimonas varians]